MKLMFRGVMVVLACSVFIGRLGAVPPPTPTPVPIAPPVSPELAAIYSKLDATLSPAARDWVTEEAAKAAKTTKMTEGTIRADIQTRFMGQSLEEQDKSVLLFVVLSEAVKDMANDLGEMTADLVKKNAQKQKPETAPAGPGGNTTITVSGDDLVHLQTAVARRAQFMTTMSNLMKKVSNAQSTVVGFLK